MLKKRILSIVISLLLVISLVPAAAFAEEQPDLEPETVIAKEAAAEDLFAEEDTSLQGGGSEEDLFPAGEAAAAEEFKAFEAGNAEDELLFDDAEEEIKIEAARDGGTDPAEDYIFDYEKEMDRSTRIGWGGDLRSYPAYLENEEYPEGLDCEILVTDVKVISNEPWEDGKTVVSVTQESNGEDDIWFHWESRNYGYAELKASFIAVQWIRTGGEWIKQELEGYDGAFTFGIGVSREVYNTSVNTQSGSIKYHPGSLVELIADTWIDAEYDDPDLSGITYEWEIESLYDMTGQKIDPGTAESFAVLTPDGQDPGKAVLQLQDQDDSFEGCWIHIEVTVFDGTDEQDQPIERGREYIQILCANSFPEVRPYTIGNIMPGQSTTIEMSVCEYPKDEDPVPYENVHFRWYYDPEQIEIRDVNGSTVGNDTDGEYNDSPASYGTAPKFTIKRLSADPIGIHLEYDFGNDQHKIWDYFLDGMDYRIWIDQEDDRLYEDGTLDLCLRTEGLESLIPDEDYEIELNIGRRGEDRWDILFRDGTEYDFDPAAGRITLYGDKISATGVTEVDFYAGIWLKDVGRPVSEFFDAHARVCEARIDYDREWDRSMLPGWDGTVRGRYEVRVENAAFPDGEDLEYRVLDVKIVSDAPWEGEGGDVITDFHMDENDQDPDDYWWYYRVEHHGEARLKVTYLDPAELGGEIKTYEFTLYVGEDVYNINLVTGDRSSRGLPGSEIDLYALTWRESEYDNSLDGVTYEWKLEGDGNEYAQILPVDGEPYHAKVIFRDLYEDEDHIWKDIQVRVTAYDGTDEQSGEPIERASRDLWLVMASDYFQILPTMIDPDLDMGEYMTTAYEVRHYPADNEDGYERVKDVHFYWFYDSNCVEIRDKDEIIVGNETDGEYNDSAASSGDLCYFTIERKGDWETDIHLEAVWFEEDGSRQSEGYNYWLNNRDYRIWFDPDRTSVYNDYHTTVTLETQDLEKILYWIEFEVGTWNHNEETGEGNWDEIFDEASGIYSIDGNSVTINGEKAAEKKIDGINIHAKLFLNGSDEEYRDAWCWVEVHEKCRQHFWAKGVYKEPTLEETGLEVWICPWCGEIRWEEIPRLLLQDMTVKAAASSVVYGKTTTIKVTGNAGAVTYQSSDTKVATVSSAGKVTAKGAGTATITVTAAAAGIYGETVKTVAIQVTKAAQPMKVTAAKKTVTASKVKKAAQTVTKAVTVKSAQGKVTYAKSSGSKNLTINKTSGKITVKKGTKKGTYKIKVKVTAAGSSNYKSGSKTVEVTVVVK